MPHFSTCKPNQFSYFLKVGIGYFLCVSGTLLVCTTEQLLSGSFSASSTSMPNLGAIGSLSKEDLTDRFNGKATITAQDTYKTPKGMTIGLNRALTSFTKHQTIVHHPSPPSLFPDDASLSQSLSTFLQALEKDSYFLVFFSKIHLTILHELYTYLTKIYATFAMTHVDDMTTYLTLEQQTALTHKTIIINHLINIIEAQSNQAIRARFPGLPQNIATYAGTVLMKHDYGSDLSLMLQKSEAQFITTPEGQAMVANVRSSYLNLYGLYLAFFNRYTSSISSILSPQGYPSGNTFVNHAQRIATIVHSFIPAQGPCATLKEHVDQLRATQRINPPLFFYDPQTMRGLKIIPFVAAQLPVPIQSVSLPAQAVANAHNKVMATTVYGNQLGYPRAFFANNRLFVNIPLAQSPGQSGPTVYAQELVAQPAWLNSQKGIIKMLAACLGDFTALLDPLLASEYILDPCLECITRNAAAIVNLGDHSVQACQACSAFINGIQQQLQHDAESINLPPMAPGTDASVPPPPPPGVS